MAGSVNKVILIGNVGKDPEVRSMQSGDRVANFTLATSETWKDRDGERKEKTTWHNIVVWNEGIVKVVDSYVRKGSKLYVEGALQTRKYTDQQGVERYTTEIVLQKFRGELTMLGGKSERDEGGNVERQRGRGDEDGGSVGGYGSASGAGYQARQSGGRLNPEGPKQNFDRSDLDDEIPF